MAIDWQKEMDDAAVDAYKGEHNDLMRNNPNEYESIREQTLLNGLSPEEVKETRRMWNEADKTIKLIDDLDKQRANETFNTLNELDRTKPQAPVVSTARVTETPWGGRTTKTVMKSVRTPWGWAQVAVDPRKEAVKAAPASFATAVQKQQEAKAADDRVKTQSMIDANRQELAQRQELKAARRKAIADNNLEVYRGLVTAFDALNSDHTSRVEDGVDVTTGYRIYDTGVKRGFVGRDQLARINNAIKRSGNDKETITSIVAVRDKDGQDPYFVVTAVNNKDNSQHMKTMSLDDVSDFARRNFKNSSSAITNADNELAKDFATTKWSERLLGKMRTGLQGGVSTKATVEAARIRATSNEAVAKMNNQTKIDLAKLTDKQKREIAEADRKLKEFGITTGLQEVQETNASKEKIATMNNQAKTDIANKEIAARERIESRKEAGRQARAVMRDNQAWEKLAIDWAKVDNDFAVKMSRADTYGKRVDLIEEKLQKDYEVAMKNAKTAEQRAETEKVYKERMADVAEGNIDLNWFKAETAADQGQQKIDQTAEQKEKDRQTRERVAGLMTLTSNGSLSKSLSANQLKIYNDQLTALSKALNTNELGSEEYNNVVAKINVIANDIAKAQQSQVNPPTTTRKVGDVIEQNGVKYRITGVGANGKWNVEKVVE